MAISDSYVSHYQRVVAIPNLATVGFSQDLCSPKIRISGSPPGFISYSLVDWAGQWSGSKHSEGRLRLLTVQWAALETVSICFACGTFACGTFACGTQWWIRKFLQLSIPIWICLRAATSFFPGHQFPSAKDMREQRRQLHDSRQKLWSLTMAPWTLGKLTR